eukprot:4175244-Karenia_brevis.AAC.1
MLTRLAFDAVHLVFSQSRTILKNAPCIDPDLYKKAIKDRDDKFVCVVNSIATLSVVDQAYQHRIGDQDSNLCPYCKACISSVPHE